MRIGLLTGGGNMAGVNAAIRAVVKTAISEYSSEIVGIMNGFEGLLQHPQVRSLGSKDVQAFQRWSNSILGSAPRGNPFQQERDGNIVDLSDEIFENVRWLGLDCIICIGGLGTLALARQLSARGLPIVAIPKSTTNELSGTDYSIGFDSATDTAVSVVDRLHSVEEEDHRVLYMQVMGREAGWTALNAGISGGGHVVLIPEIPYELGEIDRVIQDRKAANRPSTIVIVASGAREKGKESSGKLDAGLHIGPAVKAINGLNFEVTKLGPIQRGGSPTSRDRFLAAYFGYTAVKAVHEGITKHLVVFRNERMELIKLSEVSDKPRLVDPGSRQIWTALSQGISVGVSKETVSKSPPCIVH
ncbi:MAG: ATP-dependent 6-phosphofructokinase [Planctomycetota bacterium]|nr:ATP-dependent 6-phosphofructokinase [Planctomycetota bacterium]